MLYIVDRRMKLVDVMWSVLGVRLININNHTALH